MSARLNEPAERRTALPLTARDLADLEKLREPGPEREALNTIVFSLPAEGDVSESLLVHAVFTAGLRAVQEQAEEIGYAQLAAQQAASGEDAERRLIAGRRPRWADED
jgi:phosphoribosyl-dephospho-CoA transferase